MIIPFFIPHSGCPHQCVFCDQRRITGATERPDPASVPDTIRRYLAASDGTGPAEVAFFGGTFTALPPAVQREYLSAVRAFIASGAVCGIRISTRPDALGPDVVPLLREAHVTTVELGVQSFNDEVLRRSGRGHTAQDALRATALLKEEGFSVGLQLMAGLPGDSEQVFRATIAQAVSLRPDFVRIYPVIVIRDTPLERLYRSGQYHPLPLETAVSLCVHAVRSFSDAGIPVIRAGLQQTADLEQAGTVVAGPWHPSFRQLVDSAILLEAMRSALRTVREPVLYVHPSDLSSAIGQHRGNIRALGEEFQIDLTVMPDANVRKGTVATERPCTGAGNGI